MAYTTINKSTDYFNTKLWTGTGANLSITGVGHRPDFTWIKNRANTDDHNLFDVLRGFSTDALLRSNTSGAATDTTEGIKSFDSDGFSLGTNGSSNGNGQGMVSWNWKAGTTGSGNTGGSGSYKTYNYSVNTTAGFSIIKYTGNGTTGHTIPHHLGAVPQVVLVKCLDQTYNWNMYHQGIGNTHSLYLNTSSAKVDSDSFWNDTTPSSTVFTLGSDNATNQNDQNYIAYVFTEKTGYSKFGSYLGNGSSDGSFCYLGFKPAWVLTKETSGTSSWDMHDNKRDPDNVCNKYLLAEDNGAEGSTDILDFCSNGFKFRSSNGDRNESGASYIYIAFGQSLVGSNNVPCTAR